MIKAATQMNIIVLTPLCKGSFNYCLVTHPIGNMFKGPILKSLYADLTDLGQDAGIEIISITGDGDQRLRSIQLQQNHIPHKYQWLTKEEFTIVIGLNPRGQIAMQDLLHDLKKLRNNCKYLSKRLLIFATYFCDLGPFGTHPPFVVQKYTSHFCVLGENIDTPLGCTKVYMLLLCFEKYGPP